MTSADRIIKVKKGDEEIELFIKNPSLEDRRAAESERTKTWNQAVRDGAIFSSKLNEFLEQAGLWGPEKQAKLTGFQEELRESLERLELGGLSLKDAKDLALKIRKIRAEITLLNLDRLDHINETVDGRSRNAEFNRLVSLIVVYNNDRSKKYFADYEDYLNRKEEDDAYMLASKCSEVLYGTVDMTQTPENRFLKKFNFVNDKYELVNDDGHLIDLEGNLIDEEGYRVKYIKGKAIRIDDNGKKIEEKSFKPFLDKNGKPVLDEEGNPVTF